MAKWLMVIVLAVAGLAIGVGVYQSGTTVRAEAVHAQLPELIELLDGEQKRLAESVLISFDEYRTNAKRWSFAYHGLLILAALLSSAAGIILKLEGWRDTWLKKEDVTAVLAAASALAITVVTAIGLERKWQANRVAATRLQDIALTLITMDEQERTKESHRELARRLREISTARDIAIAGVEPENE